MVEARPCPPEPDFIAPDSAAVARAADGFAKSATAELDGWRKRLTGWAGTAAIWGAGSKGITFANALGPEAARPLTALIDLNPRKHGLFAPGVALPVRAPDDLRALRPDLILISNALYEAEIRAQVQGMGLMPEFA